jgi:glycine/D-amino acid oxidase-like deaminating enzyme
VLPTTVGSRITVDGDAVVVDTSRGTVRARTAVLAVGAWLPDVGALVDGVPLELPPLRVSQQQVFHFARRDGVPEWPTSLHKGALSTYSLPGGRDGGPGGARKVAEHDAPGYQTTARTRSGAVDPAARTRIVRYVEEWMPGLVPEPFAEATCLYTSTENEDFLLDRIGPVVLCSPCSGHGAKFAPLIGELTADLVTGTGTPVPRFALAAHGR